MTKSREKIWLKSAAKSGSTPSETKQTGSLRSVTRPTQREKRHLIARVRLVLRAQAAALDQMGTKENQATREVGAKQVLLDLMARLALRVKQALMDPWVAPDLKALLALMVMQVLKVLQAPWAKTVHLDLLASLALSEKLDLADLLAPLALLAVQAKQALLVLLVETDRPVSLALKACQAHLVNLAPQVRLDPMARLDLKDLMALLVKMVMTVKLVPPASKVVTVHTVRKASKALKVRMEILDTRVMPASMENPALRAFQALLGLLVQPARLAPMARRVRAVIAAHKDTMASKVLTVKMGEMVWRV